MRPATPPDWVYYADAGTYKPVELDLTGAGGASIKVRFQGYEQLPTTGNTGLLSLTAQHPGAKVDPSTADYEAAQARLFPTLTQPVCPNVSGLICGSTADTARAHDGHHRKSAS